MMNNHRRRQTPTSTKSELVLAVGGHAYVDVPNSASGPTLSPPINDEYGRSVSNDLRDGQEVEILAWRPRARPGVAYRVRRLSDGREWWLQALYLRKSAAPTQP